MNDIEWHLLEVEHSLQKDGTNCGVFMCIFFERLVNSNFDLNFLATEATLQAKRLEIKDVLLEKRSNFYKFQLFEYNMF
jgi:Ulp1 family protease